MSEPLHIEVSALAATHIRAAESWWRLNRPKAPNAIREELERVRRLHLARIRYDLYYRIAEAPGQLEILAFWHASRGSSPPI